MSDGGSGGKQSPRGCAEYSVMLTKTSLSAHHWTFLYCFKSGLRKSTNWEKNGDFFLIITYLLAEIVLENKKQGSCKTYSFAAPFVIYLMFTFQMLK